MDIEMDIKTVVTRHTQCTLCTGLCGSSPLHVQSDWETLFQTMDVISGHHCRTGPAWH